MQETNKLVLYSSYTTLMHDVSVLSFCLLLKQDLQTSTWFWFCQQHSGNILRSLFLVLQHEVCWAARKNKDASDKCYRDSKYKRKMVSQLVTTTAIWSSPQTSSPSDVARQYVDKIMLCLVLNLPLGSVATLKTLDRQEFKIASAREDQQVLVSVVE